MTDILKFYDQILDTMHMEADRAGIVTAKVPWEKDSSDIVQVDKKTLVLPTPEQLANPNWADRIAFHPLSEAVNRGESHVIEKLRRVFNTNINIAVYVFGLEILRLAASPSEQTRLDPAQTELLLQLKDVDEKTIENWNKINTEMGAYTNKEKVFVNIYLRRGAIVGGKKVARAGTVSFPLKEALATKEPFGVKVRVKDQANYLQLMNYLFSSNNIEDYFGVTDSMTAPYLLALLSTVEKLTVGINDSIELYETVLPQLKDHKFSTAWSDTLVDTQLIVALSRKIPSLTGNEGKPSNAQAVVEPVQQPVQQMQQQQPVQPQSNGLVQFNPQQAQPLYPQQNQFGYPQMQQQPMYNQGYPQQPMQQQYQQQPQTAAVMTNNGKLDFNATLARVDPMRAAQVASANNQYHGNGPIFNNMGGGLF